MGVALGVVLVALGVACLAAALVVGVVRATAHREVGRVPGPEGVREVCSCGAEHYAGAWHPRFRYHS